MTDGPTTYAQRREAAAKNAGLGVGHIWTEVRCPAYHTLNPADCICTRRNPAPAAIPEVGRQPETQLAADLVRAEAALSRILALHANPHYCATVAADHGDRDETDLWLGPHRCPTLAALDGE